MADKSKNAGPVGTAADSALDLLINQAVVDLHVARRILLIYPASHDQVKRGLSKLFKSLSRLLASQSSITLAVLKDGLAVDEQVLQSNPTAFKELATALKHFQVATLTFTRGLEPRELVRFMRIITADREKVAAEGGIVAVAEKRPLPHIKLQAVDYSKLRLTEESEIQRTSRRDRDRSIWQAFVDNLLAGGQAPNKDSGAGDGVCLGPDELADMLNQQILSPALAVARYDQAVVGAADAGSEAVSGGLRQFQQMIKELNPDLQNQFLATTFDRCGRLDDMARTARLIEGLGAELIIRMLRQASSAGKQISPSLVAFLNKIGYRDPSADLPPTVTDNPPQTDKVLSSQKIKSLFVREQYDNYVDSEYGHLLKDLSRRQQDSADGPFFEPLERRLAVELSDAGINARVGRAMTRLMTSSADTAGYRDWARQLAYLLDDLLDTRAFESLIELMSFVRSEQAGDDKERSEIAGLLMDRFSDPSFVSKAIEVVQTSDGELTPETLGFLMELGEPVVMEIFDGLDPAHTLLEEGVLTQILTNLASLSAKEALERINDPRPEYVCRMLRIIQKMGNMESAQQVRALLDHSAAQVRMEALATLLKFSNNWGVIRLRELLDQPLDADFIPALDLAGDYGVRAVVPQLMSLLEYHKDPVQREAVLRALGRIGDCRALPVLTKLAHRRWSFSKRNIDHLKRVLFETLRGYPQAEIKDLLHYGLKQKDEAIQAVCRELLREGAKTGGAVRNEN